jgi:adenosylhomocysteine nucleosidase
MTIGIMSAMREEIASLVVELGSGDDAIHTGMRTYHRGQLWGMPVVLVFSRWGKVAAASTVTHLISQFGVDEIIFTGVAGAVDPELNVGDVVIAGKLYQHDMDARPLYLRHELPLLDMTALETDPSHRRTAFEASQQFLAHDLRLHVAPDLLTEFQIDQPKVVVEDIASGDKFFAKQEDLTELRSRLPSVACVEMEGAAVAQVCHEHGVPFLVIRTISDSANEEAPVDFPKFADRIASAYSYGILRNLLKRLYPSGKDRIVDGSEDAR